MLTTSHFSGSLKWAIAGRNFEKLEGVRRESLDYASNLGLRNHTIPDILVGRLEDSHSLDQITQQTKVLISAAGPYMKYGDPVVDSCVRTGCDYIDITGETAWVKKMIDRLHETAKARGIYLVPMCGFDSVPSDLGVWYTFNQMQKKFPNCQVRRIESFYLMRGKFSGGTIASGIGMDQVETQMKNPFLLGGNLLQTTRKVEKKII